MISDAELKRIDEYLFSFRHYIDEEKAYQSPQIVRMMKDLEALTYVGRFSHDFDDDFAEKIIAEMRALEEELIPIYDPTSIRTFLWRENEMPDLLKNINWPGSWDGPDFQPFIIPSLIEDGNKHPSIIVISGGARSNHVEGYNYCKFFNSVGFNAFQLGNRTEIGHTGVAVPNSSLDLQRAIRYIRFNAHTLGCDPDHIFAIGSSLGGATIVQFIENLPHDTTPTKMDPSYVSDEIDEVDDKLSGMLGVYTSSYPRSIRRLGIEYKYYPPVFVTLCGRDYTLAYQFAFYNELIQKGVNVEVHIFNGAVHGCGLGDNERNPNGCGEEVESIKMWPKLATIWMNRVVDGSIAYPSVLLPREQQRGIHDFRMEDVYWENWAGHQGKQE